MPPNAVHYGPGDGAPPIDLIDGSDLCELLKKLGLGVQTKMVEDVSIDSGFFDDI